MNANKKFAITGGIGSGKSCLADMLRKRGYAVFSCDEIYRELLSEREYLISLEKVFPDCVQDGKLDRTRLSQTVFSDKTQLEKLNALSHPAIMERLLLRMNQEKISFAEVPLLFEGGYENLFDGVIALRRGREARIRAVTLRDGMTEKEVLMRIKTQFDENNLPCKNCVILENDGTKEDLQKKLDAAIHSLGVSDI